MHIAVYRAGRLHSSVQGILTLIEKIEKARENGTAEPTVDTNMTFRNLEEILIDSKQIINECEITFPLEKIRNLSVVKAIHFMASEGYNLLRNQKNEEDIVKYKEYITNLKDACSLLSNMDHGYIHQSSLRTYYANNNAYTIPMNIINEIFNDISCNRPFTLLDVNCAEAHNILRIRDKCGENNILVYAIHQDKATDNVLNRLVESTERFLYDVKGKAKYISNRAFDVLLISPDMTFHVDDRECFTLTEEDYSLKSNMKYLRKDGVLMFIIPKFRISREIASVISKNFTNVHVYQTDDETQEVIKYARKTPCFSYGDIRA